MPRLFADANGITAVERAGRIWEVQQWLPGVADFHERPSQPRLQAACAALARLHSVWRRNDWVDQGPCPGVLRRLAIVAEWRRLVASGWQPLAAALEGDPVRPVAERAMRLLPRLVDNAAVPLQAACTPCLLQPCLRDPWHDHYLFEGDNLTGLLDYGAVQVDHPAIDLARTLGSLVADDTAAWDVGLAAYRAVRAFSLEEEALARLLDRTGVVLAAANWLVRLYHRDEPVADRAAVARRLERLVVRMESWAEPRRVS